MFRPQFLSGRQANDHLNLAPAIQFPDFGVNPLTEARLKTALCDFQSLSKPTKSHQFHSLQSRPPFLPLSFSTILLDYMHKMIVITFCFTGLITNQSAFTCAFT